MSRNYDNWERLVAATLKREHLWQLFHEQSRSPSIRSEDSNPSSSRNLSSPLHDPAFDFSSSSKPKKVPKKLVFLSDFTPVLNAEDVFMNYAESLGSGIFGSACMAEMNNGVKIVVKKLKSGIVSEAEFKLTMEIVGNIRHENVAALRGYYSSKDERLMMHDYFRSGSVFELLHGQIGPYPNHVNWETRIRIAIGAARGIAEIHRQYDGKLFHGNIKSSNVFLNPQQYGIVSDLGLTNMIATKFMTTARCYAPEVKNTRNVSQASDVYSFGILLLELLTRKSPVDVPDGPKGVDLRKLVSSVKSKEGTAEVFDVDLLKHLAIRDKMVKLLHIGISCLAKTRKERPKMSDIVKKLEDLNMMNTGTSVSLEQGLVFVEDGNPGFSLEDMLRSYAEVLGKGAFGTSYKVILENGNTIVVKNISRNVNVAFEEFQQHMEVIGRMRHEYVDRLKAYYFSRDTKLLVYDYHNQASLSALLHGKTDAGRRHLDWETRVKIAVGAARGIAHIHRLDNCKLVHGDIKPSNIFINGEGYGVISSTGFEKVMNPTRQQTPGYCAPELVKDNTNVSQACDMYSFGVVLLQLLSRRLPQWNTDDGDVVSLVNWIQLVSVDEWIADVFDVELTRDLNDEVAMVQILKVATDCVAIDPDRRPKITEVVSMLEGISGIDRGAKQLMESRLKDLLDDLLPAMT